MSDDASTAVGPRPRSAAVPTYPTAAYPAPPAAPYGAPPAPPGYGAPSPYGAPPPGFTKTNGLAVASFVLSLVWLYWLGSLLAVIFGHIALSQISRSGGWERGKGLAIAGLVIGYVALVGLIAVIVAGAASASISLPLVGAVAG